MKRVLAIILSAVLFGVLAGGTMVGINVASANLIPQYETAQKETPQAEEKGSTADEGAKTADSAGTAGAATMDVSGIVEATMPQVVSITNTMLIRQQGYSSIFDYFYGGGQPQEYKAQAAGSGVILKKTDDELLIVTNNHVVEDSEEISVTFIDGSTVDAAIKGTDSTVDLAVVAVKLSDIPEDTMNQIKVATLHDTEDLKAGQGVIAIGNALGFGQSVTVGFISALDREITTEEGTNSNLIQVDAAINPGNSGGALLNMDGEVIGINVAKLADTKVEGVGYAIPIYKAMDVIDNLSNAKTKVEIPEEQQGRLGVYVKTIDAQYAKAINMPEGVLVAGFDNENGHTSAAEEAGVLKNDIITKFDGQSVSTAEELTKLVKYYEEGAKVTMVVKRLENGEYVEKTIDVTLGKHYSEDAQDNAGPSQGLSQGEGYGNGGRPQDNGDKNGNGSDQGQENQDNSGNQGDMYDLFRKFMEQYQ